MSTPKLAAKMVLAMKAIDAVAKNGTNKFQNYKYVQAADVAHEVRKALIDNGISFDYSVTDTDRWDRMNAKGNPESCVQVKVAVTFTDQESGEFRTVNSIGWGMDSLDKAPYKAMTGAVKYALRMNFLIPDDADPENDENGNQGPQNTQRATRPLNQQLKESIAQEDDLAFLNQENPEPVDYKFSEESYRKAYAEPEAPPVPRIGPPIGTKAKVLYAIAMGKNWTTADYRAWINRLGYSKDADIPAARFNEIKSMLEAA